MQDYRVKTVARPVIFGHGRRSPGELEIGLHATEVHGRISEPGSRSTTIVDLVVIEGELIGANQPDAIRAGIVHNVVAHDRQLVAQAIGNDAVFAGPGDVVSRQGQTLAARRGW